MQTIGVDNCVKADWSLDLNMSMLTNDCPLVTNYTMSEDLEVQYIAMCCNRISSAAAKSKSSLLLTKTNCHVTQSLLLKGKKNILNKNE